MDGLLIVDRDRRMVHLDSGAEALLGWQNSEIRGRRVYEGFEISQAEADRASKKERGGAVPAAGDGRPPAPPPRRLRRARPPLPEHAALRVGPARRLYLSP